MAVAVQISDSYGERAAARCEAGVCAECTVAFAQEHRDTIFVVVRRDEVFTAIPVEVAYRNRTRPSSNLVARCHDESHVGNGVRAAVLPASRC